MSAQARPGEVVDDVWIPTVCGLCYNQCGIRVHRVNGVVVKIEGNPENPKGLGRICAKGMAGIPMLYDPSRLNRPLKRTNPKKGFDEDPRWVEISWDEALDIITEKLAKIRAEDPRKLLSTSTVTLLQSSHNAFGFTAIFGTPNTFISNGHHCGTAEHFLANTMHGAITTNPDFDYCNYLIVFGAGVGGHAYYAFTTMAQKMADARARGMKLVVVDPILHGVAEKADE
jgi:anaerobic selenocysteine-containing dehydrogenase